MTSAGEADDALPAHDMPAFALAEFCNLEVPSAGDGRARGWVDVDLDKHANPHGPLHGGVLFTLADTTMGAATLSVLPEDQLCATIEIQLRFLRPVTGGRVVADTEVIKAGSRIVHLQSVLRVEDELVATATGTFAVFPGQRP